jgi:hypothetical protein
MSDLMKAPHVTGSKILPIGNKKFDLLQLEAQNIADLATSKDKSTSVAEKHVSCAQVYKGSLYLYNGVDTFNFLNMQVSFFLNLEKYPFLRPDESLEINMCQVVFVGL